MISYKDMTFCTREGCKAFDTCSRAYTDKVREEAKQWWRGDDAPVSLAQFGCYVEKELDNDETLLDTKQALTN